MVLGPANEKGTRLRFRCENPGCDNEFEDVRSRSDRLYCSGDCFRAHRSIKVLERTEKKCGTCKQVLPLDAFQNSNCHPDGKRTRCRKCRSKKSGAQLAAEAEARWLARWNLKRCSRCAEVKPFEGYWTNYERPVAHCIECGRKRNKRYHAANRKRLNRQTREYYEENKERHRAWGRRWARDNRAKLRRLNREKYRRLMATAPWKHRAKSAQRRAYERQVPGEITPKEIVAMWHYQRGECAHCGTRFGKRPLDGNYEIDHITPVSKGGSHYKRNAMLLCMPCNRSKADKYYSAWRLYLKRLEATLQE